MNLETWYSGKCDPKGDTFAGDQVGFADIFILDIFERVNGPDDGNASSLEKLKNFLIVNNSIFHPSPENNLARTALQANQNQGLLLAEASSGRGLIYWR